MASLVRWIPVPTVLAAWLLSAGTTFAIVPQVKDDAGFFSAEAVRKANEILRDIERRHHKDALVETFKTVPSGSEEKAKGRDKAQFFEDWARRRFRENGVTGIYILITKNPGHIQVELGDETRKRAFTDRDRAHLRDVLLSKF